MQPQSETIEPPCLCVCICICLFHDWKRNRRNWTADVFAMSQQSEMLEPLCLCLKLYKESRNLHTIQLRKIEKLILVQKGLLQRIEMKKLYDSILVFAHSPHIHQLERTKRFYLMSFLTSDKGRFSISFSCFSSLFLYLICFFVAGLSISSLHFALCYISCSLD